MVQDSYADLYSRMNRARSVGFAPPPVKVNPWATPRKEEVQARDLYKPLPKVRAVSSESSSEEEQGWGTKPNSPAAKSNNIFSAGRVCWSEGRDASALKSFAKTNHQDLTWGDESGDEATNNNIFDARRVDHSFNRSTNQISGVNQRQQQQQTHKAEQSDRSSDDGWGSPVTSKIPFVVDTWAATKDDSDSEDFDRGDSFEEAYQNFEERNPYGEKLDSYGDAVREGEHFENYQAVEEVDDVVTSEFEVKVEDLNEDYDFSCEHLADASAAADNLSSSSIHSSDISVSEYTIPDISVHEQSHEQLDEIEAQSSHFEEDDEDEELPIPFSSSMAALPRNPWGDDPVPRRSFSVPSLPVSAHGSIHATPRPDDESADQNNEHVESNQVVEEISSISLPARLPLRAPTPYDDDYCADLASRRPDQVIAKRNPFVKLTVPPAAKVAPAAPEIEKEPSDDSIRSGMSHRVRRIRSSYEEAQKGLFPSASSPSLLSASSPSSSRLNRLSRNASAQISRESTMRDMNPSLTALVQPVTVAPAVVSEPSNTDPETAPELAVEQVEVQVEVSTHQVQELQQAAEVLVQEVSPPEVEIEVQSPTSQAQVKDQPQEEQPQFASEFLNEIVASQLVSDTIRQQCITLTNSTNTNPWGDATPPARVETPEVESPQPAQQISLGNVYVCPPCPPAAVQSPARSQQSNQPSVFEEASREEVVRELSRCVSSPGFMVNSSLKNATRESSDTGRQTPEMLPPSADRLDNISDITAFRQAELLRQNSSRVSLTPSFKNFQSGSPRFVQENYETIDREATPVECNEIVNLAYLQEVQRMELLLAKVRAEVTGKAPPSYQPASSSSSLAPAGSSSSAHPAPNVAAAVASASEAFENLLAWRKLETGFKIPEEIPEVDEELEQRQSVDVDAAVAEAESCKSFSSSIIKPVPKPKARPTTRPASSSGATSRRSPRAASALPTSAPLAQTQPVGVSANREQLNIPVAQLGTSLTNDLPPEGMTANDYFAGRRRQREERRTARSQPRPGTAGDSRTARVRRSGQQLQRQINRSRSADRLSREVTRSQQRTSAVRQSAGAGDDLFHRLVGRHIWYASSIF